MLQLQAAVGVAASRAACAGPVVDAGSAVMRALHIGWDRISLSILTACKVKLPPDAARVVYRYAPRSAGCRWFINYKSGQKWFIMKNDDA